MSKKAALGRGLDALLGEVEEAYENESSQKNNVIEIDLDALSPNPYQPRKEFSQESLKELSESIKKDGLIQPIIVVEDDLGGYIIVAGERRYRATKLAKLSSIKAIVLDISKEQMQQYALIENIQREDLNPLELAKSYEALIKLHGITHDELGQYIHKSRTHITNTLRLLQLNDKAQKALIDGKISAGHAKMLVGLETKDQELLVNTIIGQKLSVRELETMVKRMKNNDASSSKTTSPKEKVHTLEISKELQSLLKQYTQHVKIEKNKVILAFESEEEIKKLIQKLS
ncbi:MAG: ParB/RepB/Spo0J family partition protein [Epsilonproteobacteria bacterium]|nr:ParB/RepB/Spo0J family partition protein [Campylobacterota bacterium]